jgi:hypothetical protein
MRIWISVLSVGFFLASPVWARDLEQGKRDYLNQVGLYRTSYSTFAVKRDTYNRSGTFAAQEDLVTAAREMLTARAVSWWNYFEVLLIQMETHAGIDEGQKSQLISSLAEHQEWLTQHKEWLNLITTKSALLEEAQSLNSLSETFTVVSYQTLITLKVADLRAAIATLEMASNRSREAVLLQVKEVQKPGNALAGF